MIAFTICARNFLAQALVLHDSLQHHHPGVAFHLALCDDPGDLEVDSFPFSILSLDELGVPDLRGMTERYSVTELNTAVKPFVFSRLFDRFPGEPVLYFDPDIIVLSPLEELVTALDSGADCVLTPHNCEPAEYAEMHEGQFLNFGIYNLGFCALRDTDTVRRIVSWWGRRLERHCVIDLPSGLFVDQKWADLLPAFIERTKILRHPGYNVAYWNLSQRTLRQTADGWQINGKPLRFFHFSGSVLEEPFIFSRHSSEFRLEKLRDTALLFHKYVAVVKSFGREYYKTIPYAFSWDGAAGRNLHTPRDVLCTSQPNTRKGGITAGEASTHLPLLRVRSFDEYTALQILAAETNERRRALEASLISHETAPFYIDGFCAVCGQPTAFTCSFMYSVRTLPDGSPIPNWREHLACGRCGFTNRLRACLHVLYQEALPGPDAKIYLTEQVTPLFRWLRDRFPGLVGSEYLGEGKVPGEVSEGVHHEDIQQLSFPDASFDMILSFDVLEHVPFERQAFTELARCLKPGGKLFFTAPFSPDLDDHEVRALHKSDGRVEHLLPPEYHGNPVDPEKGALCCRYFGWKTIDDLRDAGFSETMVYFYWSRRLGYLGDTNSILIASRQSD